MKNRYGTPTTIRREIRIWYHRRRDSFRQKYYAWRYDWLWECFDSIDKYYNHANLKEAAKHIKKWGELRRQAAQEGELCRKKMHSYRLLLLAKGIDDDAIHIADWAENVLGLGTVNDLVPADFGEQVLNHIIESNLVKADSPDVLVWSANAASQLRMFVLDRLFCNK